MSNKIFTPPCTANKIFSPKLIWNKSRLRSRFDGSCIKEKKAPFTPNNVVNLFTVYELDRWSWHLNTDFALKDCLFRAIKPTKNADPGKYKCSAYSKEFDSHSEFLFTDGSIGKIILWSWYGLICAY